jgi:hypothetical protein
VENPVPVRIAGLEAVPVDGAVEVRWRTTLQVDHEGFHVYRRVAPAGAWSRLTTELFRGVSPYVWRDDTVRGETTYRYEIGAVDTDGREVRYGPVEVATPRWRLAYALDPVRPNPFRSRASLSFALPGPRDVRFAVFDVTGRRVVSLVDGRLPAGEHRLSWDGRDGQGRPVPPGVYFLRLESPDGSRARKVVRLPGR